jgi:membrane protease YdiL (CAAX protease family)
VRSSPARDVGFAIASGTILAAYNNVIHRHPWHHRRYVALNACTTGAALSAAAASGLTPADLGVGRGRWPPGRLGAGLAAAVAGGWLLVAGVPVTRPVLADKRIASLDGRAIAYQAVVRIPVGTVLWEEVAFRGVLQAALRRILPSGAAIAVTSGVFGIWHIRPTIQALRVNGLAGSRGQATARALAGVAVTTAGGAVLSWLRERSGSLAAPVLVHLATNCGGPVAAWAVAGSSSSPRGGPVRSTGGHHGRKRQPATTSRGRRVDLAGHVVARTARHRRVRRADR